MSHWLELDRIKNMSKMKTVAFTSGGHEFRNPLNAIVLSSYYIEDSRANKLCTLAKNCSNLMLFLVKYILDFSQIEANSLILNMEIVNPLKIMETSIELLKFKADKK